MMKHALKSSWINIIFRRILFFALILFLATPLSAADVAFAEAEKVAINFFWEQTSEPNYRNIQPQLLYTESQNGIDLYYVFGCKGQSGFVIIPADDLMTPILGYSLKNTFEADSWPANFTFWMSQYSVGVMEVKQRPNDRPTAKIQNKWNKYLDAIPAKKARARSVNTLLNTQWGQSKYYNEQCPEDASTYSGHVPTGCVATAIGQIMKYHNHPVHGVGSYSYYLPMYGQMEANFGNTIYNWYNMPDKLLDYQEDVAELLFHVGVASRMIYAPHGSGTQSSRAAIALKKYFGYSSELKFVRRSLFSDEEWMAKIVAELDAFRPVYYAGFQPLSSGGHAFVCDGYDDDMMFHFNWGWGSGGGYYTIDAPLSFTDKHEAIVGIEPVGTVCPGNITFTSQTQIDNFATDYPGCSEIIGSVRISEADAGDITNLDGLSQIQSIGLGLWISGNEALDNLSGLDYVTSIGDILWIDNNPGLTSLSGLGNVNSIAGNVSVFSNPALISFTGLDNLNEIGGNFLAANNSSLVGFEGLSSLNTIEGFLFISDNPVLYNLTGLEGVTSMMGTISIIGNESLASLNGIQNISPLTVQSPLKIYSNPNLSICEVQVICDYLGMASNASVIHNNGVGCNTPAEIESACANNCPTDFMITTQQQIDDFATDHPDCIHIMGDLKIVEANIGGIISLSGLSQIQSVGDELRIEHNNSLANLNGLENITHVGSLLIGVNPSLTDISQLSGIQTLENLTMAWNDQLLNFNGLHNITTVYGGVQIHYTAVENLSGLNSLSSVGSTFIILGNDHLTNLNGLQNLGSIGERLFIVNNMVLTNLSGLDNLTIVEGNMTVRVNPSLSSLSGLEKLTNIGGFFYVGGNSSLLNMVGLNSLVAIGDYFRVDDAALQNFNGLEHLEEVGTDVSIFNTQIVNFNGLESLVTIGGSLSIDSNKSLVSLDGLQNINPETIQHLTIMANALLTECAVESICSYFELSGIFADVYSNAVGCNSVVEIQDACNSGTVCPDNLVFSTQTQIDDFPIDYPYCIDIPSILVTDNLTDPILNLDGFSQLQSIEGNLTLAWNDQLMTIEGLSNVTTIGGSLTVRACGPLATLDGLEGVTSVGGLIGLYYGHLSNIDALQNIDPNTITALDITGNTQLSNCAIEPICAYLDLPSSNVNIAYNATGCNSVVEVDLACNSGTGCDPIAGFTSLGEFDGHSYYLSDFIKNWRQAQLIAIQENCVIASISTQAENDFIQSALGNSIVLIGLNDDNIENQLVWDSGEPVTLDLSYGNTIDNDFAVMNFWEGSWEMVNQWVEKRFVLEKDCSSSSTSLITDRSSLTVYHSVVVWDVYPNPADDWLTINVTSDVEKQAMLYVYDGLGQLALSENMHLLEGASELELDISKLPNGFYHIQFEGEPSYMNFLKFK